MDVKIGNPASFALVIVFGNIGLSSVMTIIAALISKSNSKGSLYPVLSFPLLLPLLLTTINATWLSFEGSELSALFGEFQIIISYSIVIITASFLLFDIVWNE
jgi:heme exporter protein B